MFHVVSRCRPLTAAPCLAVLAAVLAAGLNSPPAVAKDIRVSGSTTFDARLMVPFKALIEEASGHTLVVSANKSSAGLLALLEGRADLAMVSAPLESEIPEVLKLRPGLAVKDLRSYEVSRTRIAFGVHPSNPVRFATIEDIRRVLTGEIANWSQLGGRDGPIRVVAIRDGGGVQTSVNSQLLNGRPPTAGNMIWVQHGSQVIKVLEQEPGAFGLAQLGLLQESGLPEIATTATVEQVLSLVTVGEPSAELQQVIEATRRVARANVD